MSLARRYLAYLYQDVVDCYTKALFSAFEKNPGAVLADMGCWDGGNTLKFVQLTGCATPLGFDVVESAVREAKRKGISAKLSDLNKKIPLKESSVDIVVANHTIEHLYNTDTFVSEIYRILKPGGYAVIGTPNLASWHNAFALVTGRQPYSGPTVKLPSNDIASGMKQEKNKRMSLKLDGKAEDALGHIVVLTYKTLVRLLRSKGFVIEKSYGFGYHPLPPFIARFLASADRSHAHYILIKARKPFSSKK
jgi:2-polyprenyl-3-methyl-5-hydroxy-6-metoxy-1,4-benzoquinol methylase